MITPESIRTELRAPDFASIAAWRFTKTARSADDRVAFAPPLGGDVWVAEYNRRTMLVTAGLAAALHEAGAQKGPPSGLTSVPLGCL